MEKKTWTWDDIAEAIDLHAEGIIAEIEGIKKVFPNLPKNHQMQNTAKQQKIKQIRDGANRTKDELYEILDNM